jgi:hypothetical protein
MGRWIGFSTVNLTAVEDEESNGFILLRGTFMDGARCGEAHVQAPDGSICLIQWTDPDDIHFQLLPISDGNYVHTSGSREEDEALLDLFPDLRRVSERHRALEHDPIYDSLPDLEQQWETWRADSRG